MSSLAAVQADGFYIDPSRFDPSKGKGSANAIANSHPLGERAKRLKSEGILVVRFELPYDSVCTNCGHFVSHGVRFNADKGQTGVYLSTPVYTFKMHCPAACGQEFAIETDPKNADYLYLGGLRRKVKDFIPEENDGLGRTGGSLFACSAVQRQREAAGRDGMVRLQQKVEDGVRASRAAAEVEDLLQASARRRDPGVARAAWNALSQGREAEKRDAAEGRAKGLRVPVAEPGAAGLREDARVAALALGEREEAAAAAAGSALFAVPAAIRVRLMAAPVLHQQQPPGGARGGGGAGSGGSEGAGLAVHAPHLAVVLRRDAPSGGQGLAQRGGALSLSMRQASTAGFSATLVDIIAAGRKRKAEDAAAAAEAAEGQTKRIASALRAASGKAPLLSLGYGPRHAKGPSLSRAPLIPVPFVPPTAALETARR
jgi:hypothetical protein